MGYVGMVADGEMEMERLARLMIRAGRAVEAAWKDSKRENVEDGYPGEC